MIGAGQKFGKYTLLERIAEGGMAEIYKASVIGNDGREHIVAIKRLHRSFCEDHELTQMLVDEARIAVQLNHPHIAQVFDLGTIDQQHFLVMEFVAGHDLHQLLKFARQKQVYIPIPAIVLTLIHVADALQYAHTRHDADGRPLQIVHRDVSPQNIMISSRGEVKLVDFGIAKAKNRAQVTQAGIIKGKYYYMAPEQAHGHHVDARTDIYAMGMVLYEGLCGRSPFEDVPEVELLKAVRQSSFPPPSYYRPDLDQQLDSIVDRMTQRDPNLRYQSMAEVRQALADFGTRKLHPFGPVELARSAEELAEVRPTVEYDILQPNAFAPSENSMIFNVESGLLELHSSEYELLEEEAGELFDQNPFGGTTDPTIVYQDGHDLPEPIREPQFQPQHEEPSPRQQPRSPAPNRPLDPASGAPPRTSWPTGGQSTEVPGKPGQDPLGYHEQDFQDDGSNFRPQLAMDPREAAKPQSDGGPRVARAASPAAPDFNAGRRKTPVQSDKSTVEKLASPPAIYGLIVLAVLLVGVLGAMILMNDGKSPEAVAEPTPAPVETTPAPAEPESTTVKFAVNTNPPNARVFVDDEDEGTTPKLLELEDGATHSIVLKRPGYATVTRQVTVSPDDAELDVDLELASGIVKIQSYPPGAEIEIDGKPVGKTNLTQTGLPLDRKLKVVALLDGDKKEYEVVWGSGEEPIQEIMFEFEEPPVTEEAVAVQKDEPPRKKAPRRKTSTRRKPSKPSNSGSSTRDEDLNVWGDSSDDEPEDLDVWGGSKKKESKEEPAPGGLDVWGG